MMFVGNLVLNVQKQSMDVLIQLHLTMMLLQLKMMVLVLLQLQIILQYILMNFIMIIQEVM